MAERGEISKEARATRWVSGGRITQLDTAFRVTGDSPFSITIIPVANYDEVTGLVTTPEATGLVVECTYYEDDAAAPHVFYFNDPGIALLFELPAGCINLENYVVFWNSGVFAEPKQDEPLGD